MEMQNVKDVVVVKGDWLSQLEGAHDKNLVNGSLVKVARGLFKGHIRTQQDNPNKQ